MIKSLLRGALLLVLVVIGIVSVAVYWTLYRPVLPYDTTVNLQGLESEVAIYWDEYGVPSLHTDSMSDMYRALGWLHARDRLWQMTVAQLFTEGRFAEFLGEDALELDRFSRTVGFWRIAGELEARQSPQTMAYLQAYSDGVNQFVRDHEKSLPVEFSLVGIHPPEWTPRHSLALSRLLGWELNVSWWTKVMLGYLQNYIDEATLRELFPTWEPGAPRNLDPAATRQLLTSAMVPLLQTDMDARSRIGNQGSHIGSNAWVSAGSKTSTGYPLLAGDPHLGLDMPGKWYEVHLHVNGKHLSGATIAGIPAVIMGQNEELAWTFTALMGDDTDFYRELVHPGDSSRYALEINQSDTTWARFQTIREVISLQDGPEVLHTVRQTQNGPVINDIYPNQELVSGELISMRWAGFEATAELEALMRLGWSTDMAGFQQTLEDFGVPALNIMYADRTGNIAMFTAAHLPVRRQPTLLLREGWNPAHRWTSFIPRSHLPRVINPPSGFIANANNPVVSDNYPYYLTAFWEPDSRIRRITDVLNSSELHTPDLFMELQNDVYSNQAADLLPVILPVLEAGNDGRFDTILPYLKNWDYRYTTTATAASLYELFFLNFVELAFKPYLGEAAYQNFIRLENFPVRVTTRMLRNGSVWLRDQNGDTAYRDSLIVQAMDMTRQRLTREFGADPAGWQWGNLHTVTFSPIIFREAAADSTAPLVLKSIVQTLLSKGPYPVGGHAMSVNNTQYSWEQPFAQILGASIRRIVDLGEPGRSLSVLPTGQSGHALSPHFGDQTDLWISGKYRILQHYDFTTDAVQRRTTILKP